MHLAWETSQGFPSVVCHAPLVCTDQQACQLFTLYISSALIYSATFFLRRRMLSTSMSSAKSIAK